jgi:hypothetical protein
MVCQIKVRYKRYKRCKSPSHVRACRSFAGRLPMRYASAPESGRWISTGRTVPCLRLELVLIYGLAGLICGIFSTCGFMKPVPTCGGRFRLLLGQSSDKRDDNSAYALQSGERPVWDDIGPMSGGVLFSKLSKLLNQENALSAPCSRINSCSPQAPPRGTRDCCGQARSIAFDVTLLFATPKSSGR